MKKRVIIISSLIILSLVIMGLYNTFATEETASNDNVYDITLTGNNNEINIPAGTSKTVIYKITNTNKGIVNYGITYTGDNITIKIYDDSVDKETDLIDYGETKFIKLYITNTGTTDSTAYIKTVLGYEKGGSLNNSKIIPTGYTFVEKIYYSTNVLAANNSWYKGTTSKSTITKIIFSNNYVVTGSETESWPAGIDKNNDGILDNNIICYLNGKELIISTDGNDKIYANEDSKNMFSNFSKLTTIENLQMLDTSKVVDMSHMFDGCITLLNLDLSTFNTKNVIDMKYMFNACNSLKVLDISGLDTSNVIDMNHMFSACQSLTSLDLSTFDTSKVTNMEYMFNAGNSLTSLDVSNFNTSKVTNMKKMFDGCLNLKTLDVSNFNTSNVDNMSYMFSACQSLTSLDLSTFDTSKVTNMEYMFNAGNSLTSLDISGFNTSKVTNMNYIFCGCFNLKRIYVTNKWTVTNVTSSDKMFEVCHAIIGGSGTTFNSNYIDKSYARIDGGTSNPGYLSVKGLYFDGVDDYHSIGYVNQNFGNTITIGINFYYQEQIETTNNNHIIINNYESAGFGIAAESNKINFAAYSANEKTYKNVYSTITLEVNNWYNVVCTYDGSNLKIYINGVFDNSKVFTENLKISPVNIMLGGNSSPNGTGTSEFFHGIISDVFATKDVLSDIEIATNFTNKFNYTETSNTYFNYKFY